MKIKDPKEYALYLLKFKDRSEKAIEQKMREKRFSSEEIGNTVKFLLENKFIDEKKLAKIIIREGFEFKFWGRFRIKQKLAKEQIKTKVAEKALEEISYEDELKSASLAKEKWLKKNKIKSYEDKQKLMSYLSRRGFSYDIISDFGI